MAIAPTDLTQRPPRSARVRLGGYVILPRMLDKGRAAIAGKLGEFKFNCPLDQQFTAFVKINAAKLKKELAKGKGRRRNPCLDQRQCQNQADPVGNRRVVHLPGTARPSQLGITQILHRPAQKRGPKTG